LPLWSSAAPVLGRFGPRPLRSSTAPVLDRSVLGRCGPRPLRFFTRLLVCVSVCPLRDYPQDYYSLGASHSVTSRFGTRLMWRVLTNVALGPFGAQMFSYPALRWSGVLMLQRPAARSTAALAQPLCRMVVAQLLRRSATRFSRSDLRTATCARSSRALRHSQFDARPFLRSAISALQPLIRSAALPGCSLSHMLSCPIIKALSLGHDYFSACPPRARLSPLSSGTPALSRPGALPRARSLRSIARPLDMFSALRRSITPALHDSGVTLSVHCCCLYCHPCI